MSKKDWYTPFSWLTIVAVYTMALVINPLTHQTSTLVFLLPLPLALWHGVRRYGGKGMTIFVVVTLVLSNMWEALSIQTGFPFGHYHYTMQPQLLGVPIVIGPSYVALGYISWQIANTVLQEADTRMGRWSTALLAPTIAALSMTVYDLTNDALASTAGQRWIWEQGGAYFGVPVSNFLGWWFCTFTFYAVFALYLRRNPGSVRPETNKVPLLQFVLLYLSLGSVTVVASLTGTYATGTATDTAGTVWQLSDMIGSSLLWVVFGMVPLALFSIVNLYRMGLPSEATSTPATSVASHS
ncbi:MAG: carotenoid biosynthesis protein [Propionibacteriaceae bacterium]|nr:carotenoid biosynthesis protein [Micropruina sp.]HBX79522.1 hypothetical protein [Propionibacteriaceae bacterium]HBY22221.1 hypothetical protein [Propionibacteriaceae bacterium]